MLPKETAPHSQSRLWRLADLYEHLAWRLATIFIVLLSTLLVLNIGIPWLFIQAYHLSLLLDSSGGHDPHGSQYLLRTTDTWSGDPNWACILNPTGPDLYRAMNATLTPALLLTATFGVLAIVSAIASRTKLIEVQRQGLTVRRKGASRAQFVPWERLSRLDIARRPGWFGKTDYKLVFHMDDGAKVRLAWRDIVTSQQGPALLSALKTWAPEAIARSDLPVLGIEDSQTNYTQLWLQYFSAPARRERSGDLEGGATIGDGRYHIAGKLSGGGHGTTYLAVPEHATGAGDELSDGEARDVVIKEYVLPVHRGSLVLDRTIEKLNQEAAILRRINHPQVVSLRDSFVEDYRGYLVMEYVQGVSLKDLVDRDGPQPESFICRLAVQMCEILSYLHRLTPPVVHRDFTPDNLILQDTMLVKLVDFNVAHELEGSVTATVVGKHSYLPPEQFRGKPVPESDIYALGCTLFYLLTGTDPEPISSSHPQKTRPDVSCELDRIVARATALEPAHRYAGAEDMKSELEHLLEQTGHVAHGNAPAQAGVPPALPGSAD